MSLGERNSSLAGAIILPVAALSLIALVGPNQVECTFAVIVLALGAVLLWRPAEPAILFFVFLYQWIQVSILAFYGNIQGVPLESFNDYYGQTSTAMFYALAGLIVLAAAIRLTIGPSRIDVASRMQDMIKSVPLTVWLQFYVMAWLFSTVCLAMSSLSAGLQQPFLILSELKWVAFILLTVATFGISDRSKLPFFAVFLVEFGLGFGGFFADFREVFFYSALGITFTGAYIIRRNIFPIIIIAIATIFLAVAWSAVKRDYRDFISEGTREQVVLVSYQSRMSNLFDRLLSLNGRDMALGADKLMRRISYIEFFGVVVNRMEVGQKPTGGDIWGAAIVYPLMPRIFFPKKPSIDDTKLTSQYTGIDPASWSRGVSVSLGYMTEAYIDFGPVLMFMPVAALGVLLGGIYRWLMTRHGLQFILGVSLAPFAIMPAHLFETSVVKLFPNLMLVILACIFTLNFVGPQVLQALGVQYRRKRGLQS